MKAQKPQTEKDYVALYAQKLKEDARFFTHHKKFIESQYRSSLSLFSNMFAKENFKAEARAYLKKVGMLK